MAAGCYTIWDRSGRFIYAGMAGRGLSLAAIAAATETPGTRSTGLRDRLASHRAGRRSGDQFCVYVFDRLVLPALSSEQIAQAAAGDLPLDGEIAHFIRTELSYRWVETADGKQAFELEALLRSGALGAVPLLNPLLTSAR